MRYPQYLYHWTHRRNLRSILTRGLDPARTTGKRAVVWACERSRVLWAAAHVAANHGCAPDDLVLLRIWPVKDAWRHAPFPRVWTADAVVPPLRLTVQTILCLPGAPKRRGRRSSA